MYHLLLHRRRRSFRPLVLAKMTRQHRTTLKLSEDSTVVENCVELIDNTLARFPCPGNSIFCSINEITRWQMTARDFGTLSARIEGKD